MTRRSAPVAAKKEPGTAEGEAPARNATAARAREAAAPAGTSARAAAAPAPRAASISEAEIEMMSRLRGRIEEGRFELPQLRSDELRLMDMVADPAVEISDVVGEMRKSPSLAAEVLRVGNSALYATQVPCEDVREAVLRIGSRALRSVLLSVSMRGLLLGSGHLAKCATEVWKESYERGELARVIASMVGFAPERAYVIGLLQDIGKIPLLAMMRKENIEPGRGAIGAVFRMHHERAGAAMAARWKLGSELTSVAGCHHDFASNQDEPRGAALASLLHRIQDALSQPSLPDLEPLLQAPEMDALGLRDEEPRRRLLEAVQPSTDPAVEAA